MRRFLLAIAFFAFTPAAHALDAYLDAAGVQLLTGSLTIPSNIAATLWRPAVEARWWATTPATLVSDPEGRSPFVLGSPAVLDAAEGRYITKVPAEGWHLFYYETSSGLGAGVARFPSCWSASQPSACISRVVIWIGSGDNRLRSVVTASDAHGFNSEGTLFVSFDMKALSLGLDVPGSRGSELIRKGLAHVLRTLGADRRNVRVYLAGFSAGGAAALHTLFEAAGDFDGVAAMAPILLPWDIYGANAPAWAQTYALHTVSPERYEKYFDGTIVPMLKPLFTAGEYRRTNAYARLVRGESFRPPLLIIAGADDDLGAATVATLFAMTNAWRGPTQTIVYGPVDLAAGRKIDFASFPTAGKSRMAVVFLRETNHVPVPSWNVDMRRIMMDFFLSQERDAQR
jgi:pimeloyl-ACP methyl ester carboxylesterase